MSDQTPPTDPPPSAWDAPPPAYQPPAAPTWDPQPAPAPPPPPAWSDPTVAAPPPPSAWDAPPPAQAYAPPPPPAYAPPAYGAPMAYGAAVPPGYAPKSKMAAGLLGIFLGAFGIHNFYLGYTGKAVAQLILCVFTCGFVSGIWGLIEGIMILTGSINTDANGVPLAE